jgi:hypothetical protein
LGPDDSRPVSAFRHRGRFSTLSIDVPIYEHLIFQEHFYAVQNPPAVQAVQRCVGCAESFCSNCLIDLQGQKYCGSCKVMAMQGGAPAVATKPCKEAKDALVMAIIGLFCFGIILEPLAIAKALKAKKLIADDPTLTGSEMATAALVIAIAGLCLWVVGMFARFSQIGQV